MKQPFADYDQHSGYTVFPQKNSHGKKKNRKKQPQQKKNRKNSHGKKKNTKNSHGKKEQKNFLGLTIYMEKKARIETHKSLIK